MDTNYDNLWMEGPDIFDEPATQPKAAKKGRKHRAIATTPDFVGCPMSWLQHVLPHFQGASQLAVVLLLYRRWVLEGRPRKPFVFPNGDLQRLGITRLTKYRTLAKLKNIGLIAVILAPGRAPRIKCLWKATTRI